MFPPATAASYSAENWLLADGDEREVAKATDENVFRCDTLGSIGVVKSKTVALIRHPGALEAANPSYETRIFGPDRVRVQGRLVGLIRRY